MRKILESMLLSSVCVSNVFAEGNCCEEHSKDYKHSSIYLRTDLIGHKFHREAVAGITYKNKNYSYGTDIGLGYYAMDRLRVEFIVNYNFMTRFKATANNNLYKSKAAAKAVFLRGMFDIVTFDKAKLESDCGCF